MNALAQVLRGRPGPLLAFVVTVFLVALAWSEGFGPRAAESTTAAPTDHTINPFERLDVGMKVAP